jgi:hypothetical protein
LDALVDVDGAIHQFEQRLRKEAKVYDDFTLVSPADRELCRAYWQPQYGIWVAIRLDTERGKYWCSYGTRDPAQARAQTFVCQINVQRTGDLWRTAGSFAKDGKGQVYYVHTGKIGSGNGFSQWYRGPRATVRWANHAPTTPFVVGRLDDRRFVENLATYVNTIARFRAGDRNQPLETYYRNAIMSGVDETIEELQQETQAESSMQDGASVSQIRLTHLQELQKWLRDDPELLQKPVDILTSRAESDRRRRVIFSVSGAAISVVVGWLLSAVSPTSLLHLIGR